MKYKKKILIISTLFFPLLVFASSSNGIIDATYKYSKICHDTSCVSYGRVNWKPTINASTPGASVVSISDTSLSGYIWGDEIGWINLTPTGSTVSVDPSTGVVTGKAYAGSGSWINFSPTGSGVTINSSGQFSGWAWVSGPNGGWMKFDCSSSSTCVSTDWRPVSERTTSSGSSGVISGGGGSILVTSNGVNVAINNTQTLTFLDQIEQTLVKLLNQVKSMTSQEDKNSNITEQDNFVPTPSKIKILNTFDTNRDGKPDILVNKIVDVGDKSDEYRESFPAKNTSFVNKGCYLCVVERRSVNRKEGGILKFGFVPKALELRIPTSKIFRAKGMKVDYDVDVLSSSIAVFAITRIASLLVILF